MLGFNFPMSSLYQKFDYVFGVTHLSDCAMEFPFICILHLRLCYEDGPTKNFWYITTVVYFMYFYDCQSYPILPGPLFPFGVDVLVLLNLATDGGSFLRRISSVFEIFLFHFYQSSPQIDLCRWALLLSCYFSYSLMYICLIRGHHSLYFSTLFLVSCAFVSGVLWLTYYNHNIPCHCLLSPLHSPFIIHSFYLCLDTFKMISSASGNNASLNVSHLEFLFSLI